MKIFDKDAQVTHIVVIIVKVLLIIIKEAAIEAMSNFFLFCAIVAQA
jgi:hypothetical protein